MIRKIGKKFLFFLFFSFQFLFNNDLSNKYKISLMLKDHNGNSIEKGIIGIPFIVELIVDSDEINIKKIRIENIEKFSKKNIGTSTSINNINGKMSVKKIYQYELRIDKEGDFSLGPIFIDDIKYEKFLTINVEKGAALNKAISHEDAFFKIAIDKDNVYLKELIELTIKFYFKDNVKPIGLEFPELKHFYIRKNEKVKTGNEIINNNNFSFQEWKFAIFPQTIGDLIIPAFKIYYEIPINISNIFSFFGLQNQRKELFSNSLNISVKNLPQFNNKINGVGFFKNFKASVNQNNGTIGEGIVLKLEIEGNGQLEDIRFEDINVEKKIKYYDSKKYIGNFDNNNFAKKTFEFILQFNEAGNYIIPEQIFTFFNLNNNKIEILKTKPIELMIRPAVNTTYKDLNNNSQILEKMDEIIPINKKFSINKVEKILDNNWFIFFLLFPLLINIITFSRSKILNNKFYCNFILVRKTKKQLNFLLKNNDYSKLLFLFNHFISNKFKINCSDISPDLIKNKLRDLKLTDFQIKQWEDFYLKLIEASFSNNDLDYQKIINDSKNWFNTLKTL